MAIIKTPEIAEVFRSYPPRMRQKLLRLRELVLDAAAESECIGLEETLKWGEPSYVCKGGSAVRLGWKEKTPHQYMMYFNCQTKLVDTFKELYRDKFKFEGNRAIVFDKNTEISTDALKHCISSKLPSQEALAYAWQLSKSQNQGIYLMRIVLRIVDLIKWKPR
ncbi:MAG: DUF1801 domain-containing protein [Xanthomonadales bacterium]|nr:DUF1801 domain-containing protein [Xanthomonadales bacterium]